MAGATSPGAGDGRATVTVVTAAARVRDVVVLLVPLLLIAAASSAQTPAPAPLPVVERVAGSTRVGTSVATAQRVFDAADTVVVAAGDAAADALVSAPLAAAQPGPLLLTGRDRLPAVVAEEIARLGATQALVVGGEAAVSAAVVADLQALGLAVSRIAGDDRFETAAAVAREVGEWSGAFVASGAAPADAVVAAPLAAIQSRPVLLVTADDVPAPTAALLQERAVTEVVLIGGTASISAAVAQRLEADGRTVGRIGGADRIATAAAVHRVGVEVGLLDPGIVWLADRDEGGIADALAAGPAIAAAGGSLLLVDGRDLTAVPGADAAEALRDLGPALQQVVLLGGSQSIAEDAGAQLAALLRGRVLPGGGLSLLPERRLVALYGSHFSPALGVLGEQAPAQVGPRLDAIVGPYRQHSDRPILPAFDLIATIATAAAGPEGLYRARSSDEDIQAWLDAARANDAYLVLDLQPGRSDFLTEAQVYERFLTEPDVGLALDPEWRVTAPQTPGGGTIGSVTAAEVNAVSAWLAALVAEHDLPEKLLIVHNFRVDMIRNRDELVARDGLATLLHMDGLGGRAVKLESYRILRQEPPFYNGFKLFFDEDVNLFQPAEVLQLDPVPDFISYQ